VPYIRWQSCHAHTIGDWYWFLPPVSAAEAGDSACDDHHQTHAHRSHDQEQFQVDLTVLAGVPGVAVAGDLGAVQHTLTIPVTQLTLRAGARAKTTLRLRCGSDVQVSWHALAVV